MRVERIAVEEIPDSRGNPTIAVAVTTGTGTFSASVPSGKSRGSREAQVADTAAAVRSAAKTGEALRSKDFTSVGALDQFLIELDGTPEKATLGGNVTLGVSTAFARALAGKRELWQALRDEYFAKDAHDGAPAILSNLINGGAHAENNLDIQEYLAVVKPLRAVGESVERLKDFYHDLGGHLQAKRNVPAIRLGDEGGYSLDFENNFAPLATLAEEIRAARLEREFSLGIDAAASNFFKNGSYTFGGKALSGAELEAVYTGYRAREPLLTSIEDPFAEVEGGSFATLREKMAGALIVGDDLTVTNPALIARYAANGSINAVIIKPNQIGTVSETCEAIRVARRHGVKVIVSHRSGETDDVFIIHLARACGADGVKIGAPARERLVKFNELVRLYG